MALDYRNPETFPRPPLVERTPRTILIRWPGDSSPAGQIASSTQAYWVLETHHPPTYYIPPQDIKASVTARSAPSSYCEWKGAATYHDVQSAGGATVTNRAWSYQDPTPDFACIKGHVSFYADPRWECFVDGEKVEPQPGDFYGGWMTRDIIREKVKGAPGTTHW